MRSKFWEILMAAVIGFAFSLMIAAAFIPSAQNMLDNGAEISYEGGKWVSFSGGHAVWQTQVIYEREPTTVTAEFGGWRPSNVAFSVYVDGDTRTYQITKDGAFVIDTGGSQVALDGDEVIMLQQIADKLLPIYPKLAEFWKQSSG